MNGIVIPMPADNFQIVWLLIGMGFGKNKYKSVSPNIMV